MSVLIEALCLVVTRETLNEVFPGGAEAFLEKVATQASSEGAGRAPAIRKSNMLWR